jgi:hypothetical protein
MCWVVRWRMSRGGNVATFPAHFVIQRTTQRITQRVRAVLQPE